MVKRTNNTCRIENETKGRENGIVKNAEEENKKPGNHENPLYTIPLPIDVMYQHSLFQVSTGTGPFSHLQRKYAV